MGDSCKSTRMLVSDTKCKLNSLAHRLVNHVKREAANEIAHVLARDVLKIPNVIVDMEVGPHCTYSILIEKELINKAILC